MGSVYNVSIHPFTQNLRMPKNIIKPKQTLKKAKGAGFTFSDR